MKNLPKLTHWYWVLMLLCTTMGELVGNLLSRNFELGYTKGAVVDICIFSFVIAVFMGLRLKNDIYYWILILIGNIGGTNLADWVTLEPLETDKTWGILAPLQLGTQLGSLAVMGSLILILAVRYGLVKKLSEKSLFVNVAYWIAILLSSTFGTTSGDLITNDTPLGAFWGSIVLLILLAITYFSFKQKIISKATGYWSALVLIHPVGATIGNWVSKPIGLDLGNVWTNAVMIGLFAVIFIYNAKSLGFDTQDHLE